MIIHMSMLDIPPKDLSVIYSHGRFVVDPNEYWRNGIASKKHSAQKRYGHCLKVTDLFYYVLLIIRIRVL